MKKIAVIQGLNLSCKDFLRNGVKKNMLESSENEIIHGGMDNQRNWEAEYLEKGYEYRKVKEYEDLEEADIIFFDPEKRFYDFYCWWKLFKKKGLLKKVVAIRKESEAVDFTCGAKVIYSIQKAFPIWMTYQDDIVNNKNIFKGNIIIPNGTFTKNEKIPFSKRNLCILICANKKALFKKNELYSERKKIIMYYEKRKPEKFQLYGPYWKNTLKVYYGPIKNKREAYNKGKFAICLENSRANGYITEKIFDCFINGIVPVYGGAYNIKDYIPEECYIDYFSFANLDEMDNYLENMSEKDYNQYLKNIEKFLKSEKYNKMALKAGEDFTQYLCPIGYIPDEFRISTKTSYKMFWEVKIREKTEKLLNSLIDELVKIKKKVITK